jgi:hypothetical protein
VPKLYDMRGTREAAKMNSTAAHRLQEARSAGNVSRSIPREHCFVCRSAFLRQRLGKVRATQGARRRIRFCRGCIRVRSRTDGDASAVK